MQKSKAFFKKKSRINFIETAKDAEDCTISDPSSKLPRKLSSDETVCQPRRSVRLHGE